MTHLKDYIASGGFMIYPIMLASLVSVAVMIERAVRLYRIGKPNTFFAQSIKVHILSKNADAICAEARGLHHPLGRILTNVFSSGWAEGKLLERRMSMAGSLETRRMQRFCGTLAMIASTAPLMGLLGTVMGMIKAFMQIYRLSGNVSPAQLAGGIWEALLTTAAGLFVAIPTLLAYHIFSARVDSLMFDTRYVLEDLFAEFLPSSNSHGSAPVDRPVTNDYGL